MLTRLGIDGFKNMLGLAIDFGPFTCIAGVNASQRRCSFPKRLKTISAGPPARVHLF
jgi:hypothetical protein